MKKFLFLFAAIALLLAGCTKDQLVKKIKGTYALNRYVKEGKDLTESYKSSHANYELSFEDNDVFRESYLVDGIFQKNIEGEWYLINSNKDLQLTDTAKTPRIYNILKATSTELKLFKGNEEFTLLEK
jgi:hypothetical protein